MNKTPVLGIILATIGYLVIFLLGATSGLIHPACFAFVGTFLPILFAFAYLYVAANLRCFGAAAILNGFTLVVALIAGEGNPPLIIGLVVLAVLAEIIRGMSGYDTLKGVRRSFVPLAFSFYAYAAHWWTDTAGTIAAAVEEMPAGYADTLAHVVANIPLLVVMLVLVIPVSILGMRLAEKVLKKQAASLG